MCRSFSDPNRPDPERFEHRREPYWTATDLSSDHIVCDVEVSCTVISLVCNYVDVLFSSFNELFTVPLVEWTPPDDRDEVPVYNAAIWRPGCPCMEVEPVSPCVVYSLRVCWWTHLCQSRLLGV